MLPPRFKRGSAASAVTALVDGAAAPPLDPKLLAPLLLGLVAAAGFGAALDCCPFRLRFPR